MNDRDRQYQEKIDAIYRAAHKPITYPQKCPRCNKVLTWNDVPKDQRDIFYNGAHYRLTFWHCGTLMELYGTSREAIVQGLS